MTLEIVAAKKPARIPSDRVCSNCGNATTRMVGKYPLWRRHEGHIVCQKCYGELKKRTSG